MKRLACCLILLMLGLYAFEQEVLVPAMTSDGLRQSIASTKSKVSLNIPFFDDFSNASAQLDSILWADSQATVGFGYGPLPPTIGVLTLDALDASGRLYSSSTLPFSADTITSREIRLDSITEAYRWSLSPDDSVYFSFAYLPGGSYSQYGGRVGDMPEIGDSLVLEFFNPRKSQWNVVWATPGIDPDTMYVHTGSYWQTVVLPIVDTDYFVSNFRFRFRNICSLDPSTTQGLISNSDHWNIDYVLLDYNRTSAEPYQRDIAFVTPAPSFLKNYTAMPASQYRPSEMADHVEVTITNLTSFEFASHYGYSIYDAEDEELYSYDGGFENVPPYFPMAQYQQNPLHAHPAVDYQFDVPPQGASYRIAHVVKAGTSGDDYPCNDTVVFIQKFANYYAYDDGTAENGYGLTSTSSNVFLGCKYQMNNPDTLKSVHIYFNRTRSDENLNIGFRLTVWADNGGRPGEILYRDNAVRFARYGALNEYQVYELERPLPLSGTVYIGLQQESSEYLNIGFDRNNNHGDRIFYRIGSEWQHCALAGSLMLRPYFSDWQMLAVGEALDLHPSIYPNPAIDWLKIEDVPDGVQVEIFSIQGQKVYTGQGSSHIDVSAWPRGVYVARMHLQGSTTFSTHKIIFAK